nr:SLC13 family permease [Polymorphobacter fuscus]
MFVSERIRHDLVALLALLACVLLGLVPPGAAFSGFSDPAVIAVAAILVVGRAVELSGVAASIARVAIPARAGFGVRLSGLLVVAALLSAFMNNIAALVITMPIATAIARQAKRSPAATLMPLAFATILGGMTTLIGTPANLILSSVREQSLGSPFGFFTMTPVGVAVAVVGLGYLVLVGWRLLPVRASAERESRPPWRVYELAVPAGFGSVSMQALRHQLRGAATRLLAVTRSGAGVSLDHDLPVEPQDRLLLLSRNNQWETAETMGLVADAQPGVSADAVTARVVVAHGSLLIGLPHADVALRSDNRVSVVGAGPRAARLRMPLRSLSIEAGDQLFVRGEPAAIASFATRARLLEIDRIDPVPVAKVTAGLILAVFGIAIAAIVFGGVSPAIAFVAAAIVLAATRLIPTGEIYRSIDWSVIVLLGAMIPVGESFQTSGAAAIAARLLSQSLADMPLFVILAAVCSVTMLLSIFLNNVATAIIMGPLAIDVAQLLGVAPDAALLAVLIGASADFLTPIGHQNNLLVMGPGGYRFTDYARVGGILVVLVICVAAATLTFLYG